MLFPFFDTCEACSLRLVCRELKQAVADFPWEDMGTVIRGSVALWRACFPRARGANAGQVGEEDWHNPNGRLTAIVDGDFGHFVVLRALNMRWCTQVTDAAFVHLRGIERLNMRGCNQATITDAAFEHLKGIQVLCMHSCNQAMQPLSTSRAFRCWTCLSARPSQTAPLSTCVAFTRWT